MEQTVRIIKTTSQLFSVHVMDFLIKIIKSWSLAFCDSLCNLSLTDLFFNQIKENSNNLISTRFPLYY